MRLVGGAPLPVDGWRAGRVGPRRRQVGGGERGWTVAVHGAKGGVGASLLACQIALTAAARGSAALVDLDVTGGSTSALLGLEERGSMLSLLPDEDGGRAEVAAVARRHRSGLALLAAEPFDPAARRLDGRAVRRLLDELRGVFDVLVVDVPAGVDDRGVGALTAADVALLVVTPEVPCVLAGRRLVEALARHRFRLERLGVLVNMLDADAAVAGEQVALALSLRLAGVVPFDRATVRALVECSLERGGVMAPGRVGAAVAAVANRVLPPGRRRDDGSEALVLAAGAAR